MSYRNFQVYFFIFVLGVSTALTLYLFHSYLTLLAFGGVLAIVSRPLYRYLLKNLKYETAAAFLTVLCVAITVVLPTAYFIASLAYELSGIFNNVRGSFDLNKLTGFVERILPVGLHSQVPAVMEEIGTVARGLAGYLSKNVVALFSDVLHIVVGFLVILVSAYYILKDGTRIKRELIQLSPLHDANDEEIFQKVIVTVGAVMGGIIVVGIIKGVLASLFFVLFRVPTPLFWGLLTGVASFVPILGSSLVTVPVVAYLLITGQYAAAIGVGIVSVAIIGLVDNLLQPKLVQSKTSIHPLLILLSILGGLRVYGFAGFILGPLTLAVTMSLISIYKKEFGKFMNSATLQEDLVADKILEK